MESMLARMRPAFLPRAKVAEVLVVHATLSNDKAGPALVSGANAESVTLVQ